MSEKKDKLITEFNRLSGIPVNENEFIPGLSDSQYGLTANVVVGQIENGRGIYETILHNPDVVKVISKLDNPEIIKMIEILNNYPEQLQKLVNSI